MCGRFALDHDADELSDLLASQLARTNRYQQQQTPEEEEEATRDGEQEQEGEGEQIDEPVELAEEPRVPVPSGSGIRPAAVGKERSVRINWDSSKEMSMFKRRYNIAPQTWCVVLLQADTSDGGYVMEPMKWGLIPSWTKRAPSPSQLKTINCRDDTLFSGSGMWNSIRGRRRCIVIAAGFYEWLTKGKEKIPHFVKPGEGQLMLMAGLWDSVTYTGETDTLKTFTIITTSSNSQLSFLHDRMPAILSTAEEVEAWLSPSDNKWTSDLQALIKPFDGQLECFAVAKEVGKVGNESSDFVKPVKERKGNIASLFAAQARTQSSSHEKPSTSSGTTKSLRQPSSTPKLSTARKNSSAGKIDMRLNPDEGVKAGEKVEKKIGKKRERDSSIEIVEEVPVVTKKKVKKAA